MKLTTVSGIILTLLLLGMLTLSYIIKQTKSPEPPVTEWSRTYGGTGGEEGECFVKTVDGGYALAGRTYAFGAADFWLVKVDSSGNMEWNRTYGGGNGDVARSIVETSDGGYALAGWTRSLGAGVEDFWLVKVDSSGNHEWDKTYGGTKADVAECVVQTSDGGYALAGYTWSFGAGQSDFWLVKTDSKGKVQWSKTYGGVDSDRAQCVVETSDGGYALAGFGIANLLKTNASGNQLWKKHYGGSAYSVVEMSDGGYALAGMYVKYSWVGVTLIPVGQADAWLVETDTNGSMEWSKTYGGNNADMALSLVVTDDGGYAFAGSTESFGAGSDDFWLVKTNSTGHMQWNQTYGGTFADWARCIVQTEDGGYALAGTTYSFGAGNGDFWLIKIGCTRHDVAITNVIPSTTVVGQDYTVLINVTVENQGAYSETFNVTTCYNETAIVLPNGKNNMTVTLTSRNSTIITFTWNTTGVPYGNYTISAYATPVSGETETTDNTYINGDVLVTIPGDVNGDRTVDGLDLDALAEAYGSTSTSPNRNPNCDINGDDKVDASDFFDLSKNYRVTV